MAREYDSENQDLVVPHGTFANLLNGTSGGVDVVVGPQSVSPAATDAPVVWDKDNGLFQRCSKEKALRKFYTAAEGQYIVLKNPAHGTLAHPGEGARHKAIDLQHGRKVNIAGPISIALWPGQEAEVVHGHHLRSNQYLLVRVYNDISAMESKNQAVVKTTEGEDTTPDTETVNNDNIQLHTGQLMIIKGTDASFYIPQTGIEVVKDEHDNFVRDAETLERLEFCILLDENGNKRYVVGPDVVFPEPTETFISQGNSRKGRALELNNISGIYVKVIEEYEENEIIYHAGEELFITGNETALYYPRQEHSIIKYGDRVIHYATAIPEGEGRYVLNRHQSDVRIQHGPSMFLPNPSDEVIIRRILTDSDCQLLYPGNAEALEYNRSLTAAGQENADMVPMAAMSLSEDVSDIAEHARHRGERNIMRSSGVAYAASASTIRNAAEEMIGSGLETTQRKRQYTRPRTLTLDTKYDGVVTVDVYNNHAALFTRKNGSRRVVVGPRTVLLEYDERPVAIKFSTGDSKDNARTISSAFLRVLNNRVSDQMKVETQDGFFATLSMSYHLNFTGDDAERWFDVENYVQFLCERMRSIIRREAKRHTITDLKDNAIDIIRTTVLGEHVDGEGRPGRTFSENSMHVFEMDVSTPVIDNDVEYQLRVNEQEALRRSLELKAKNEELRHVQEMERISQAIMDSKQQTSIKEHEIQMAELTHQFAVSNARVEGDNQAQIIRVRGDENRQSILDAIANSENERMRNRNAVEVERLNEIATVEINKLKEQAAAISPALADAIRQLGDDAIIETVVKGVAPLSILGGDSVAEVLSNLFRGTPVESAMKALLERTSRSAERYVHDA